MRPQMRIQPVAKSPRHEMFCTTGMRDVRARVHAGVGAARAVTANLLAADRLDRIFDRALHGCAVVLDLPAAIRRAVIFDGEFVAGHVSSDLFWLSLPGLMFSPGTSPTGVRGHDRHIIVHGFGDSGGPIHSMARGVGDGTTAGGGAACDAGGGEPAGGLSAGRYLPGHRL